MRAPGLLHETLFVLSLDVAKCNLGEVKLERIGLGLSPIAVRDMRGGPLGSCRASLGTCC